MDNQPKAEPLLFTQLTSYKDVKLKLEKFKVIRKGAPIISAAVIFTIAFCCLILGFLFGSVSLAFYLGSLFGSLLIGFGCVALLFVLTGIMLLVANRPLQTPIVNLIIRKSCN